jgi:hypothetical protein
MPMNTEHKVTGGVCEKNRPKCSTTYFSSKLMYNLYREKEAQKEELLH